PQLVEVLNKAMAKDRNDRFESCAAFKAALGPFWEQLSPQEIFTQYSDFEAIINENNSLSLKTPTPQITDPNLISAAHNQTGKKSQTPCNTITTGEVVLPNNSKNKAILIIATIIGTAFIAYFGISYFQSGDDSSASPIVATANKKIEKQEKVAKDPTKNNKNLELPPQVEIKINNLPEKAKVYLDNTQLKKPFRAKGQTGSHILRIEAEDYKPWDKSVKLLEPNLNLEYDGEKLKPATKKVKNPIANNKHKKKKYKKPIIKKTKKKNQKTKKPVKTRSISEPDF
ncbi:MAG: PEGA domain-containing protein, partial [Myxococcota bacterium]